MSSKITGFDGLSKKLDDMQKKAKALEEPQEISFEIIFDHDFMRKYTIFSSIQEFFDKSPFEFESPEEFEAIPDSEIDQYTQKNTNFNTWEEMLHKASEIYVVKQLGF